MTENQQYLMIQNPGVLPTDALITLGVSTTRMHKTENSIGNFGSGSKHAVTTLLRHGLEPIIYCGLLRIEFYTQGFTVKGDNFWQIYTKITGKDEDGKQINREEKRDWTLNYGEDDWRSIDMALREFFSNAIDEVQKQGLDLYPHVFTDISPEKPRAKAGHTRIYIPLCPEVEKYVKQLPKRFLHYKDEHTIRGVLPKTNRNLTELRGAAIYKKGVLIRELNERNEESLFDYNFGDELELDESRNSNEHTLQYHAANVIANAAEPQITTILEALEHNKSVWEISRASNYLDYITVTDAMKLKWQKVFSLVFGNGVITDTSPFTATVLSEKNYKPVVIVQENWRKFLMKCGIKSWKEVLTEDELAGKEVVEPHKEIETTLDKVWSFFVRYQQTFGKEKPKYKTFKKRESAEGTQLGYYRDGTIYINKDIADGHSIQLISTIIEEMAHYVTGSKDFTREFQTFGFNFLATICQPMLMLSDIIPVEQVPIKKEETIEELDWSEVSQVM